MRSAASRARALLPAPVLLLAWCLLLLAGGSATAQAQGEWVRVEYVNDGDTVTVIHQGKKELVRLLGVDAPETVHSSRLLAAAQSKGRPAGLEADLGGQARQWLGRLIPVGSLVRLELDPLAPPRDPHGRLLAYLYLNNGPMINDILLDEGLARAYRRCNCVKQGRFLDRENRARAAKRGFWVHPGGP